MTSLMTSLYKKTLNGEEFVLGLIHDDKITYNLIPSLRFIEAKGKYVYSKRFRIHRKDIPIIKRILVYMIKDQEACKKYQIDLNKGLLLTGPIGVGKTALMHLLKSFTTVRNNYEMVSSRMVALDFSRNGFDVISRYCSLRNYCFDDLGLEQKRKRYGESCNVMGEILLSRYDLFISKKVITHATTNLNAQDLENFYGNRARSRMKEMFNLISFENGALDKRL